LRVIKNNTLKYQAFYKSIPYLQHKNSNGKNLKLIENNNVFDNSLNKLQLYFDELLSLQNRIKKLSDVQSVLSAFENVLNKIIPFNEVNIFLFDDPRLTLVPIVSKRDSKSIEFINKFYKEGILDWVFETSFPKVIPDMNLYNANGARLNFITFPLVSDNENKGILTILSSIPALPQESMESRIIRSLADFTYTKIESIKKKEELKSAYKNQQLYQSKLLNDYKLAAIGELTGGIVEEILSPLQVIMCHIDLLKKEKAKINESTSEIIKNQINKVESVVRRLVKFADINNGNVKIQPCDLNKLIEEYYNLLSSTLISNKYECILDLADSLPPILSSQGYIYQILTNVFSVISSSEKIGGGILIQTRFIEDKISVRIVVTEKISSLNSKDNIAQYSLRIVNNLMKKHEGELKMNVNGKNGSIIVLTFPLKRKIR